MTQPPSHVLRCNIMSQDIQVRLKLEGEEAKKFDLIKNELGLEHNSEVLRFLLKKHYDKNKDLFKEED